MTISTTQAQQDNPGQRNTDAKAKDLRDTINWMDCLSQEGFTDIIAVAKLALAYMETPDGHHHWENIAYALRTIWGKAEDIQNCINGEAESVGCNYTDESSRRRWDAYNQACASDEQLRQRIAKGRAAEVRP